MRPNMLCGLLLLTGVSLSGCGSTGIPSATILPQRAAGPGGRVRGGQQPLSGSVLQLYAVGMAGNQSAAKPLLTQTVTSAADGSFSITGLYRCDPADLIYLTASGGNPGLGSGVTNSNALLMSAIGPCANLTASLNITVNEATTVAAVSALAPFMSSPSAIGYSPANHAAIGAAFDLANQLVGTSSGTAPGPGIPLGFAAPVSRISNLANILAACVNSAGGSSGDGSPCGTLFALTNPSAPDTASVLLSIFRNPSRNTLALYQLPSPNAPFQPSESVPPADLSVALIPTPATSILPGANVQIPFTEGSGSVAHDLSPNHNDCVFASGANAPAWVSSGIDHLSPGFNNGTPRYCSFAPSQSVNDLSESNSRTKTWCGFLRPITYGMQNVFYSVLLGGSREAGIAAFWMSANNKPGSAYYAGSYAGYGIPASTTDSLVGWHCVTMTYGSRTDSTADRIFYDDTEVSEYDNRGASWDLRAAGDYDDLGHTPWFYLGFFEGITSYLLEYPTALTPNQIAGNFQALQTSVFAARGVGGPPAQSSSTESQILCNGDSITNETPGAIPYCNELTGLNQSFNITNIGHAGSNQLTMVSNVPLVEGVLYAPHAPLNIASMAGGINDININSATADDVFHQRVLWAQRVALIGWRPVWLTMTSSKAGVDPIVQAVNASLRASAVGLGVTLVDTATDPCLGASGAYANPNGCDDFTDGIHPSQAGEDSMRNSYVNVINYLTGSTAAAPTLVFAATYQIRSADASISASPSGSSTRLTLPSCIGYSATTPFTIANASPFAPVTLVSPLGQTLNGATSSVIIPNLASVSAVATPLPAPAGGCAWIVQ